MKKISALLIVGSFWLYGFTGKTDNNILGTWKGGYGTEKEIIETTVKLMPGNKAEVYESCNNKAFRSAGLYELKGDTAFVLSYNSPVNEKKLLMQGNINKSKNFVDGVWQVSDHQKGSFYLEKQHATK